MSFRSIWLAKLSEAGRTDRLDLDDDEQEETIFSHR